MIKVEHLTKKYAAVAAVDGISFEIAEREIVGFLGPNGAGKSTTLKVLTGYHAASGGRVTIGGKDVFAEPESVKKMIGYLPENVPLYPEMRVREYLHYRAGLKGVGRKRREAAVDGAMGRCRIDGVADRIIGQLSKGYRQRVGLADALVADPPILILDEPTIGLDPGQIREVRELIRELGKERTVLLSSHILPEVEAVCSRVLIINRGRIAGSGRPDELRAAAGQNETIIDLEIRDGGEDGHRVFEAVDGITAVDIEQGDGPVRRIRLRGEGGRDVREAVFDAAVAGGLKILSMGQRSHSLEDVFVDIVTREETPDEPAPPPAEAAAQEAP